VFSFSALALDRVFSLALIAIVAALYGVGADTDTYYLALIVPAALGLAMGEMFYTSFMPYFTGPSGRSTRMLNATLRLALPPLAVLTAAYVAVIVVLNPSGKAVWLAFAGGLAAAPLGGLYAGFLTARRQYALATLRIPLITGVALAVAVVLLPLWPSIAALAVAISVGHIASVGILALRAHRGDVAGEPKTLEGRPGIRVYGAALSVFVAALLGPQLVIVIERALASTLESGAVTLLVNARGFVLVAAMAAQAIGTGVFPLAVERYERFGAGSLRTLALVAIRLGVLISLTCAAYVVICRSEVIRVALQRGKFTARDAHETARLIAIMAPTLLGISVATIGARALFGVGRQRIVAWTTVGGILLYIGVALGLRAAWGVEGLAAAFLVSSLTAGFVMALALVRALALPLSSVLHDWVLVPSALAIVFTAASGAVWLALRSDNTSLRGALLILLASGVAGLAALAVALVAGRAREYELIRNALRGRTMRGVVPA
jgi:putative peptidoglycan lipid II flippase